MSYGVTGCVFVSGLEALVAMVERRRSGIECGIQALQCLEGEQIWQAAAEGRWSPALGCAALAVVDKNNDAPYIAAQETFATDAEVLRACAGDEAALFL